MNAPTAVMATWLYHAMALNMLALSRRGNFGFGFSQIAKRFRPKGQRYCGKYRAKHGGAGWPGGPVLSGKAKCQKSWSENDAPRRNVAEKGAK